MIRPRLIVMVKDPRAGRVKTRLAREIGTVRAAWWFRHQTARLLRDLRDPRWRIVLAVSPDRAGMRSRAWPVDLLRAPQGRGSLGARMARQLRADIGRACVIGADIPGVSRAHIAEAFQALGSHPAVIGPALDGGFWLFGLRHPRQAPPTLFRGVRWSGPHAMADTLAGLRGMPVARVDTLRDVDTLADLRAVGSDFDMTAEPARATRDA